MMFSNRGIIFITGEASRGPGSEESRGKCVRELRGRYLGGRSVEDGDGSLSVKLSWEAIHRHTVGPDSG